MKILYILFTSLFPFIIFAQSHKIQGKITAPNGEPISFVIIEIKGTNLGATSDSLGNYEISNLENKHYSITASAIGFQTKTKEIDLSKTMSELNFTLEEKNYELEELVITGTKTFKRKIESAVIVNVIDSKTLNNVQACNLSEGLKFQPGLRVETDCQTCNYTQLRMNGLGGAYSQILINGRPIFSPLTGLYGMEQLPVNMIERIEVVRGGGSALYGSSAIGGTVNVITKIPKENYYEFGYMYSLIGEKSSDHSFSGNVTVLNQKKNAGVSFFVNNRIRDFYDHNNDNFSELPTLKNTSFGTNFFLKPSKNQKLELNLSSLNEYRFGGEMLPEPAYLTAQSEERDHKIIIGNLDYQINFNQENSSLITYIAVQNTKRKHYTGVFPDDSTEIIEHLANPPYGNSDNTTFQFGSQLNHRLNNFLGGKNVLTIGLEYLNDKVLDEINAYNYHINQNTRNLGVFFQSDWAINQKLTLLGGLRIDQHNFVNHLIFNPRTSLLYKFTPNAQFRFTWGTGFRAPQAFDADLHIAFAGGGVSRISLSPSLQEERSNSFSTSFNYDKATEKFVVGFTTEAFYTHLKNAFYLHPIGEDEYGLRFEKQNGTGATVQGFTLEIRGNYAKKIQVEAGFTIQSSLFDTEIKNTENLEATTQFLRTPSNYGYAIFTFNPNKKLSATINMVYTGSMKLVHFGGAPEQKNDAYIESSAFTNLSVKLGYKLYLKNIKNGIELYAGIKNIANEFQSDFDTEKNRDSNYIYGPSIPRTIYLGLKIFSI